MNTTHLEFDTERSEQHSQSLTEQNILADYFEPDHEKTVEDLEVEELVDFPIELTLEEIGRLAIMAHNRDMKLNDFLVEILVEHAEATTRDNKNKVSK